MRRQILVWSVAFAVSATGAAAMLATALRERRASPAPTPQPDVVAPRDASKLPPVDLELIANKIREGDLLALKKDLPAARAAWSEARAMGRGLWAAHEGIADSYARNAFNAEAESEYAIAEQLAPEKPRTVVKAKRARNLRALGRPAEALQLYLASNRPALAGEIVELVAGTTDRARLVSALSDGAAANPWLWFVLHAIHARTNEKPAAAKALGRYVVECAPWDGNLVKQAIDLLRAEKLVDEALAVGRAYAKAVPQDAAIYISMGDLLTDAGRTDEAALSYSSIVDLRPGDAEAHRQLAQLFLKLDRRDDARAQIEAARKLRPDIDFAPDLLALQTFELRIVMTWDTRTDIDLYVTDPKGETVSYQNRRSTAGAVYHVDNTTAFGPETYTLPALSPGPYKVWARFCSGTGRTNVKMDVVLCEGTPKETRSSHVLVLERQGQDAPIPNLVIR